MKTRKILAIMTLATVTLVPSIYATPVKDTVNVNTQIITTCTTVNDTKFRDTASTDGDIINFLDKDTSILAKERVDNWYKVEVDGAVGYVYKSQIDTASLSTLPYTQTSTKVEKTSLLKQDTCLGEQVIAYAKQFLGNPYVYGGNSLTRGVDCSGFTSQIYKKFDIDLQRSSRAQYISNGYKVSKNNILPGDLVFYGYNGYINHVAIYAGNNQIIHANSSKTGIIMSRLEYGKPIVGIKRVVK